MKTRDEIIAAVSELRFSSRQCFYAVLDQFTVVPLGTGEIVRVRWPDALGVLTIEQWNEAYEAAMGMCADMRGYRPPVNGQEDAH